MTREDELIQELRRAHAELARLSTGFDAARQRRREAVTELRGMGRSLKWIAGQIGVTAQAVDSSLKHTGPGDPGRVLSPPPGT